MTRYLAAVLLFLSAIIATPDASFGFSGENDPTVHDNPILLNDLLWTVRNILSEPSFDSRYTYNVSAGVRILLFWYSRDDVGEGYIQSGHLSVDPDTEVIELVMGSDPDKAPRRISRWGAATETHNPVNGIGHMFGFMKASKGKNVSQMEGELEQEDSNKDYYFESIVSRISSTGMYSVTVPIHSPTDINLHQLPEAEEMVLDHMGATDLPSRFLDAGTLNSCGNTYGMLFALRRLTDAALSGMVAPIEQCYFYNSKSYILKLEKYKPVGQKNIAFKREDLDEKTEHTYKRLLAANFKIQNTATGNSSKFDLLIATEGDLRGVPVQVRYQPNWWFRVVLNLDPEADSTR